MKLRYTVKKRLRKFERTLLSKDYSYNDRMYTFYLLMLPVLEWVKPSFYGLGLSKYEVETEIYLLVDRIFKNFDPDRSSLVPYLERSVKWHLDKCIRRLLKTQVEEPAGLLLEEELVYHLSENFYWNQNNILFEERYVGKCFTRAEKYLIYRIINMDSDKLSQRKMSESLGISRENLRLRLNDLKRVFTNGGYNG